MKFKKAFAWILAVAMVITLMPSMVFATTSNTVAKVPTVAQDSEMPAVEVNLKAGSGGIERNDDGHKIRLTLENATWTDNPTKTSGSAIATETKDILTVERTDGDTDPTHALSASFISASDNTLEFLIIVPSGIESAADNGIKLVIDSNAITSGSEDSEVKLNIDGLDSPISSSSLTIANVNGNNTVATTNGDVKTYGREEKKVNTTIEIRETAVNSITGDQIIKLTLPKGVTWKSVIVSGDMINNGVSHYNKPVSVGNTDGKPETLKPTGKNRLSDISVVRGNDGRSIYLALPVENKNNVRQSLTIESTIEIGRTAAQGDINVELTSYYGGNSIVNGSVTADASGEISDASDLTIARYGDETVTVSTLDEESVPTIISGYDQDLKDKKFYVQVTLKENLPKSLTAGKYVDFVLPESVQITAGSDIKYFVGKNPSNTKATNNAGGHFTLESEKDTSRFSFLVPSAEKNNLSNWNPSKANTLTIYIPVTVRADFTGDITLNVSGAKAGVEDTELLVGKAISPITVEAATTEVRNGMQSQNLKDITITENIAGYLAEDGNVTLDIDTFGLNGASLTAANVEVTDGDLEIKNVTRDENKLTFKIKESSTKASTISITGVSAVLNRTMAEGPYALRVYGNALIKNGSYKDTSFRDPDDNKGSVCAAKAADYINIVTPADPSTITNKINAVFTLRQDTFINNGETVQMDTAPYLDANNRTQLPIRYAAIACGVPESDISWNQATQTATINGQNVVLRITIGSNIMQTSAGNVTMDTAAVSSNGRIFVPIRYIANALGADVAWDQDAKTITLTN